MQLVDIPGLLSSLVLERGRRERHPLRLVQRLAVRQKRPLRHPRGSHQGRERRLVLARDDACVRVRPRGDGESEQPGKRREAAPFHGTLKLEPAGHRRLLPGCCG